ncbi:MAG: hypothetical protein ACP5DZ_04005, partial [Bacteroidales bacterium]
MKKFLLSFTFIILGIYLFGQKDCQHAISLTPGTQQCATNDYLGTNGSFPDDGSAPINECNSSYNDGEYWFEYTGTGDALQLDMSGLTDTWSGVFVFDDCPSGSPNCIASNTSSTTDDYSVTTPALTNGATYYIVIANWGAPDYTDFCLDATEVAPPVCSDCSDPEVIPSGTTFPFSHSGTTCGACNNYSSSDAC